MFRVLLKRTDGQFRFSIRALKSFEKLLRMFCIKFEMNEQNLCFFNKSK